jgi:hypothetical protein
MQWPTNAPIFFCGAEKSRVKLSKEVAVGAERHQGEGSFFILHGAKETTNLTDLTHFTQKNTRILNSKIARLSYSTAS